MRQVALALLVGLGVGLGIGLLVGGEPTQRPVAGPSLTPSGVVGEVIVDSSRPKIELATLSGSTRSEARSVAPIQTSAPIAPPRAVIEKAAQEASGQSAAPEVGAGQLSGRVLLGDGTGLEGVVVRTFPSSRDNRNLPSSDSLGRGAEAIGDLADELEEEARDLLRKRSQSFEAKTDAGGQYLIQGVPDGLYSLRAYREGYSISARRDSGMLRPGEALEFIATPVISVGVTVLLPDGTPASSGRLRVAREGRDRGSDTYDWREGQELRLTPGVYEVTAYAGELYAGAGTDVLEMASEEEQLIVPEAGTPAPLVLQLGQRTGLHGRVLLQAEDSTSSWDLRVVAQRIEDGDDFDPDQLAERADHQERPEYGRYAFLDLDPGRYAVAVRRRSDDGQPLDIQYVELGGQVVELDLQLQPIDNSRSLLVRVVGPEGLDLQRVEFNLRHRGGEGRGGVRSTRDPSGAYALRFREESSAEAYFGGAVGHTFELIVGHSTYGEKTVPLTPGQRDLFVAYEEPSTLLVRVAGLRGSDLESRLYVTTEGQTSIRRAWGDGSGGRLEEGGTRQFEGLAPGPIGVALRLMSEDRGRRWNPMTMDRATIDLQPGSNTLTLNLPALYQLEVEAPGLEEGTRVTARKISKDPGERDYSVSARVDANGRAVIGDLITGTYKVSANGRDQTVEVPSGMIVLKAKGKK